ncbi:MAG: aa3-type cytochrome c oxidase subunit IV [Proteobacteria bacterium]|nr:aa3-type cytochrome c oxidase subunit IV [Pseudomonadota bacterium]MCH8092572.1 aa3-type cytochrome c oxidase subunit IV [Pseudomonadota bacterium]MCH8098246.1 aa3-type cytochrome c oxidase subunit IV [Pseudomonadota bacterium]
MADDFDLESRVAMWRHFTRLVKYSIASIVMVLVLMAVFLL